MKIAKKTIPATETGKIPGDYSGQRNFNSMPDGQRNPNKGTSGRGQLAPRPSTKSPNVNGVGASQAAMARVKPTGKGPQLGVTTAPTGPHPAGLQKSAQPQTRPVAAAASQKPKNRTHPFFGSNALGY